MKKLLVVLVILLQVIFVSSLCFAFDVEGVTLGNDDGMLIKGYYEFELIDAENANTTFDAHKVVLHFSKQVVPNKVYVAAELEFEHFPRLDDSANSETGGDGELKLDSAIISIEATDTTRAYCGVFYVPFGIEFESYPGHKNKLITRPKAMKSNNIINGTWNDVGVAVEQKIAGVGKFDLYTVNGDANHGGVSRDSKTDEGGNSKSVGARISVTEAVKGLNIGASYVTGRYDYDAAGDDMESKRWGIHVNVNLDELIGSAMGATLITEVVGGTDELDSSIAGEDRDVSGLYVQLSLKPAGPCEIVVRHDIYDNDSEVDDNENTATSIGFSHELYDHTKLKLEYQMNEEGKANEVAGEQVDNDQVIVGVVVDW